MAVANGYEVILSFWFWGQLAVSNLGNVPIYDLRIKTSSVAGFSTENARDIAQETWPKYGLTVGGSFVGNVSVGGDVTLIPILLGNSEKGKRIFACSDNGYIL